MAGGPGEAIVPRRIKPNRDWEWSEADDEKVAELRAWWKEISMEEHLVADGGRSDSSTTKRKSGVPSSSPALQGPPVKRNGTKPGSPAADAVSRAAAAPAALVESATPGAAGAAPGSFAASPLKSQARPEMMGSTNRVTELQKFIQDEKLHPLFHKPQIAFKDLLLRNEVSKVMISGFRNGQGNHVEIPESLLGNVREAQLLFIICEGGLPRVTEKLVAALAFGLRIVDSRFLIQWGESTFLPDLDDYPVKNEWKSSAMGISKHLVAIEGKVFAGQAFSFHDTSTWMISSTTMEAVIKELGGEVIKHGEQGKKSFILSSSPVDDGEAFHPEWIIQSVLAGQVLPSKKWRFVQTEEDLPASQAVLAVESRRSTETEVRPIAGRSPYQKVFPPGQVATPEGNAPPTAPFLQMQSLAASAQRVHQQQPGFPLASPFLGAPLDHSLMRSSHHPPYTHSAHPPFCFSDFASVARTGAAALDPMAAALQAGSLAHHLPSATGYGGLFGSTLHYDSRMSTNFPSTQNGSMVNKHLLIF